MHILGDDQKKQLKIGRVGTRDEEQTRILAIVLLLAGPDLADRPFITGVPCSSSDSAVQMAQSFTSPVLADPSACLPLRPTSSSAPRGIPVPSIPDTGSAAAEESPAVRCRRVRLRQFLFPTLLTFLPLVRHRGCHLCSHFRKARWRMDFAL